MRSRRAADEKWLSIGILACAVSLALVTFVAAYPEVSAVDSGCCSDRPLAKDFSAYYTGAWRLLHDPSQVYTPGFVNDGEYQVAPQPESFKYLPSFLVMASPILALPYQQALYAFDLLQFALLVPMAFFIYRLSAARGPVAVAAVAVLSLLQPSPLPHWGLSASYFWQWGEGQAKVFQTFLLLGSFYLARSGRPAPSGAVMGLASFDPRFALVALPLFLYYNRGRVARSLAAALATAALSNLALVYPGMASGFLGMLATSGLTTGLYYYSFIPLLTVLSITGLEARGLTSAARARFAGPRASG